MAAKTVVVPENSPLEFTLESPTLPFDLSAYTVKAIAVSKTGTRVEIGSGTGGASGVTITLTGGTVGSLTAGAKYRVIFPADTSWTGVTPDSATYPTIKGRGYSKLFLIIDDNA